MFKSTKLACVFVLCLAAVLVLASCGQDSGGPKTHYIPSDALTNDDVHWGWGGYVGEVDIIYQNVYSESELDGLPIGATIIGMRLQNCSKVGDCEYDWLDSTVSQFEVRLSTSENEAGSLSNTMSANRGSDEVIVIPETSWDIVAADYHSDECQAHIAAGTGPCAFGPVINFENPFVYAGGSILMEVAVADGSAADIFYVQTTETADDAFIYMQGGFDDPRVATVQINGMINIAFVYTD